MFKLSRSAWMVLIAILIILVGLFLVCAQRQATDAANGEDLAVDDDQFKQELLQLLDLTEDSTQSPDVDVTAQPEDDVLALLETENQSTQKASQKRPAQLDTPSQTTSDNLGISAEMFNKLKGDVDRLERDLEARSAAVDSLRAILNKRNSRLQELEARVAGISSKPSAIRPRRTQGQTGSSAVKSGYEKARELFESYRYRDAINAFTRLLEQNPDDVLADNCQYWIGESYFGLKEYQQAIMEFQKVFAYSMTDKYDDAQLMIGLSYVRSGQKEKAQKEFETFLNTYAGSEYVGVARRYYREI
ncbi:tetratricopeptide repeat protein [bacterium]|nr:tetratricopeptide repeat protein [bacterium]